MNKHNIDKHFKVGKLYRIRGHGEVQDPQVNTELGIKMVNNFYFDKIKSLDVNCNNLFGRSLSSSKVFAVKLGSKTDFFMFLSSTPVFQPNTKGTYKYKQFDCQFLHKDSIVFIRLYNDIMIKYFAEIKEEEEEEKEKNVCHKKNQYLF